MGLLSLHHGSFFSAHRRLGYGRQLGSKSDPHCPAACGQSKKGSQYASQRYQAALKEHGMICSMSGKGECWDNAPAESHFGRLKEELIYRTLWESRAEVVAAVDDYLQSFYNSRRLHFSLGFCSPVDYELQALGPQPKT